MAVREFFPGLRIFTLLVLGVTLMAISVHGQSREELEKQRKQIQQEIQELQKAQSSIKKDKKASLGQLSLIQNKLAKRNAVINNINAQVKLIDDNIYSNNREIYRLQKQIDTLKEHYGRTIEYAYKNRSNYDMLNFIFSATSFNDAVRRVAYLKSYRSYRDDQVANINKTREMLQGKIIALNNNKKEKSQVLVEQSKELKTLEVEKKEKSSYLSKIKERERELGKELDAKKRIDRNLQNAIASIVRREIEAARKRAAEEAKRLAAANASAPATKPATKPESSTAGKAPAPRKANVLESTPEVTRVSVGFENNRRNLPWPVDKASVNSSFGRKKIEGTTLIEDNIGLTLGVQSGATVKAVFEGIVSSIYDVAGSQTVTIKHGKYFTTYYNLTSVSVSKGTEVKMGQVIGRAGENDDGEGEILFVVNNEAKFENPELWLKPKN
ncbi:MAG: peptidoglycan DD-metalloendopeptidase family protein [Chitinophagaceae bacterium]|jgi:septal ring factor EnvC (AmiA/AmiB activator)|nr:peptidoglycan DD-metalloendopeptidase family protein [Chitinophagaceae bacterium]